MIRLSTLALATVSLALIASPRADAQDGPLRRAGRALDNAGKNIRNSVETEVNRGQVVAQERTLLSQVSSRLSWDKQMVNSSIQLEIRADGTAVLRGSVMSDAVKKRAVDLVENTIGVTAVVDELAIVKDVRVIQARPVTAPAPVTTTIEPVETRVLTPRR